MPTFIIRAKDGSPIKEVKYTKLVYTAGSTTHILALHKCPSVRLRSGITASHIISDPISGLRLCWVEDDGANLSAKQLREVATADLDRLVRLVGAEVFNARLQAASAAALA